MLSKAQTEFYQAEGYLILDDIVDGDALSRLRATIARLLSRYASLAPFSDDAPVSVAQIDNYLSFFYQNHPQVLVDIQRIITRLPEFSAVSSNYSLIRVLKQLMGLPHEDNPLYVLSNCAILEYPDSITNKESYTFHTNWHDDMFWTIPESPFIHVWLPVLHDAKGDLGPLQFCRHSHLDSWEGRHDFYPDAPFNYRYGIKPEIVERYDKGVLEVSLGQVLVFNPRLIHASGANCSEGQVRMTMIGLYHDALSENMRPLTPSMYFRERTPEMWFYDLYGDERVKPYLSETLDGFEKPPGGI